MGRSRFVLCLGLSVSTGLLGCGHLPLPLGAATAQGAASITDSGQGGNREVEVNLSASPADFQAQSVEHRWISSDVTEFDVVLAGGGQQLAEARVMPKSGQSEAIFTHLRLGVPYTLTATALGNPGGNLNAQTSILNATHPATASVSFYGSNDVSNEISVDLQIQLDDTVFSGQAPVGLSPVDGIYAPPPGAESGLAGGGAPGSDGRPGSPPPFVPDPMTAFPTQAAKVEAALASNPLPEGDDLTKATAALNLIKAVAPDLLKAYGINVNSAVQAMATAQSSGAQPPDFSRVSDFASLMSAIGVGLTSGNLGAGGPMSAQSVMYSVQSLWPSISADSYRDAVSRFPGAFLWDIFVPQYHGYDCSAEAIAYAWALQNHRSQSDALGLYYQLLRDQLQPAFFLPLWSMAREA